jgi:hypothetical protein
LREGLDWHVHVYRDVPPRVAVDAAPIGSRELRQYAGPTQETRMSLRSSGLRTASVPLALTFVNEAAAK